MKCKLFWTLSSDCSDSHKTKLVVLITDSPADASPIWTPCWLIAMVKLDFQCSQQTSLPAPVLVRSHQLRKRGQVWSTVETDTKPTWTHCAKGGAALTVRCCRHRSPPRHNAPGVPEDQYQNRTIRQLDICLWVNRNDTGTNTLSKTRLFMHVISLQTNPTQTGLEFKLFILTIRLYCPTRSMS